MGPVRGGHVGRLFARSTVAHVAHSSKGACGGVSVDAPGWACSWKAAAACLPLCVERYSSSADSCLRSTSF